MNYRGVVYFIPTLIIYFRKTLIASTLGSRETTRDAVLHSSVKYKKNARSKKLNKESERQLLMKQLLDAWIVS